MFELITNTLIYVWETLLHNSIALSLGVLVAVAIKLYVDPERFRNYLEGNNNISIPAVVLFGALTPFCACGTMAIVVSMLATMLPWGPVMAFLVSSPLMAPDEFIMIAGVISMHFAVAVTVASILIGLVAGYLTHIIEKKTEFLEGQIRFLEKRSELTGCGCDCECNLASAIDTTKEMVTAKNIIRPSSFVKKYRLDEWVKDIWEIGIKTVLLYFSIFAAIGYLVNVFIPQEIISNLFSGKNIFSVPLSAIIGLPLYVTGPGAIPLMKAFMDAGASEGAMLAFMITGPGTSAAVIAGIMTILKKKAAVLYVVYLLAGAIFLGYLYDFILILYK